jgi:hypothetical protein
MTDTDLTEHSGGRYDRQSRYGAYLTSAETVRKWLSRISNEVYFDQISVRKGRALGYLASIILNALGAGEFEDRLQRLEKALEEQGRIPSAHVIPQGEVDTEAMVQ